jgi:hypothetical protein
MSLIVALIAILFCATMTGAALAGALIERDLENS